MGYQGIETQSIVTLHDARFDPAIILGNKFGSREIWGVSRRHGRLSGASSAL